MHYAITIFFFFFLLLRFRLPFLLATCLIEAWLIYRLTMIYGDTIFTPLACLLIIVAFDVYTPATMNMMLVFADFQDLPPYAAICC